MKVGPRPSGDGGAIVNFLDLDLDPRHQFEDQNPRPIEELKEVQIGPSASHKTKIGTTLEKEEEDRLMRFLFKNRDLGEEKQKAAKEETNKLLAAGFVREVQYPSWLANMVMICTNYTDLNKACSKDPYLLPNIDRLVDGASSFALLSFMDAYLGYNQIRMHP
ncbi:hypothetical protein CR513_31138, partial [Mucuna pruriens]